MIKHTAIDHRASVAQPDMSAPPEGEHHTSGFQPRIGADGDERLRGLVNVHFDFVWRSLRRLGLSSADADDASQQVFLVAARKLDLIQPGCDRSFLFGTAMRVASDFRRAAKRRPEVPTDTFEATDPVPSPDELTERRRARDLLDEILEGMPLDLRTAFVLFELEELSIAEISAIAGIPTGTVSSRLRRARELFRAAAKRARARDGLHGGMP